MIKSGKRISEQNHVLSEEKKKQDLEQTQDKPAELPAVRRLKHKVICHLCHTRESIYKPIYQVGLALLSALHSFSKTKKQSDSL